MALKVVLYWSTPHGSNDGTLSLWLADAKGLFPVGNSVDDTSFTMFDDEDSYAFVGLQTLEPEDARYYADILLRQPYPLVDVPQAGLQGVHPAEALLWALEHLRPPELIKRQGR